MRLLQRRRRDHRIAHGEELALVVEALALPRLTHDGQRLFEARLTLAVRDAEAVVRARAAAAADAEVEAALAQLIDRGDFFGDTEGMRERQHDHGHADPNPVGSGGHEGREIHRRGLHRAPRVEVDLTEPHAVEAPRFAGLRQLQRLGERGGLAGAPAPLLHEDADVHEYPPVAPTIPRFGYACIRAPPMARQTRSAVTGMSMCRRPSGASASLTAFISAGSAPTVPASPTPLAPSGFTRVGTSYESTSKAGTSSARGIA